MTVITLGVGRERQSPILKLGLSCKPMLLFGHRGRVCPEKGKIIERTVKHKIIHFSCPCLVDDLPRFVEALQSKGVVGEVGVRIFSIRCKARALHRIEKILTPTSPTTPLLCSASTKRGRSSTRHGHEKWMILCFTVRSMILPFSGQTLPRWPNSNIGLQESPSLRIGDWRSRPTPRVMTVI